MDLAFAVFAALFSVVNPIGAVPVFLAMTPEYTKQERSRTARNTSIYFVLILLSFFLAGTAILGFFGISLNSLKIAGGLIIFGSGASLLSGNMAKSRAVNAQVKAEALEKVDISFTPMAMPLLSGPGSISLMIGYFSQYEDWSQRGIVIGSLIAIGIIVFFILRAAPYISKILGVAGLRAISRIMGFIVMAIGIELIVNSINSILKTLSL